MKSISLICLLIMMASCSSGGGSDNDNDNGDDNGSISADELLYIASTWRYEMTNSDCYDVLSGSYVLSEGKIYFNFNGLETIEYISSEATGNILNHFNCSLAVNDNSKSFSAISVQQGWPGFVHMLPLFSDGEAGTGTLETSSHITIFTDESIRVITTLSDSSVTTINFSSGGDSRNNI